MAEKMESYSTVNELSLYHGTNSDTVDGICAQNFDWRLCGTNGTLYGQGSYFAKNASYSHNYTLPDVGRFRYMFVSKVLVGRYTKGISTMKRPPPVNILVDEHTLYDSCVDDPRNPTIYVVFERDQCYPQYLITYVDNADYYSPETQKAIRLKKIRKRFSPLSTPQNLPTSQPSVYAKVHSSPSHAKYSANPPPSNSSTPNYSKQQQKGANCVIS